VSLGVHLVVAVVAHAMPEPEKGGAAPIPITLAEIEVPEPPPPVEEPPPPEPEPEPEPAPTPPPPGPKPAPLPAAAPEPPPSAPPAPASESAPEAFADLGMMMGGGSGGPGGMALPSRTGAPRERAARSQPKTTSMAKAKPACDEPEAKLRPKKQVQATYTNEARQAEIEGSVRLRIRIDTSGKVTSAEVTKGLGYGLDESAVAAALQYEFHPATRCGTPIPKEISIGVRFAE